jgi:transposase
LRDWLPANHLVCFVSDVVDNLNLSAMEGVSGEARRGQPPYDRQMMTKLLVYGNCAGLFSSRRVQQRLTEDIAFRVLAAGHAPDFRSITFAASRISARCILLLWKVCLSTYGRSRWKRAR